MTEDELKRQMELETFKMKAQGRIAMMGAVASFEQFALKTILILNGGALVGILGILGALRTGSHNLVSESIDLVRCAVWSWIAGLVLAAIAIGCGWLSQQRFYEGDPTFANLPREQKELKNRQGEKHRRLAITFASLGLIAFAAGCLLATRGLL